MRWQDSTGRILRSILLASLVLGSVKAVHAQKIAESRSKADSQTPPSRDADVQRGDVSRSPAPALPADNHYTLGPGDVLDIRVWKEPQISGTIPVRPDGKISLALVGELQASGQTPAALQATIDRKLENYIEDPQVTVVVQQINSRKFNVLGEVQHPGSYPLIGPMRVLDGLAQAGGFRDFAKLKSIYVLRRTSGGDTEKFHFNYKDVVNGKHSDENIRLEPGDTVVVP